jgi:hypothetical protein
MLVLRPKGFVCKRSAREILIPVFRDKDGLHAARKICQARILLFFVNKTLSQNHGKIS